MTIVVCTELSGKEGERHVGDVRVMTPANLGGVTGNTPGVLGSYPHQGAKFPICNNAHDADSVKCRLLWWYNLQWFMLVHQMAFKGQRLSRHIVPLDQPRGVDGRAEWVERPSFHIGRLRDSDHTVSNPGRVKPMTFYLYLSLPSKVIRMIKMEQGLVGSMSG